MSDPKLRTPRSHGWRPLLALIALAAVVFGLAVSCSTSSEVIDRLTIVNRTSFDFEIKLSDADKQSWQILGTAINDSATVNEMVADEGRTWVFRFDYGGKHVDDVTVDRSELQRNRWRLVVPARIAEKMRQLGFVPPPDR